MRVAIFTFRRISSESPEDDGQAKSGETSLAVHYRMFNVSRNVILAAGITALTVFTITNAVFAAVATIATIGTTASVPIAANTFFASAVAIPGFAFVTAIASILAIALGFLTGTDFGLLANSHFRASCLVAANHFCHFGTSRFITGAESFCFQTATLGNGTRFRLNRRRRFTGITVDSKGNGQRKNGQNSHSQYHFMDFCHLLISLLKSLTFLTLSNIITGSETPSIEKHAQQDVQGNMGA
ncbi:MAG: hypothetical protein FWH27_15880 [Planctomycetaceae bacterium]|nr:hypothetical protein [Planctomycetaceae bacterium]